MTKKQKKTVQDVGPEAEEQTAPHDAAQEENLPEVEAGEQNLKDLAMLDDLREQLEKAQEEKEEFLNMAQRVQADFENYKRRNQSVRADAYDDGKKDVLTDLLPVLDNFERALAAAEATSLKEGVVMIHRQLLDMMGKFGVTEIHCEGKPFDPEEANAVMQEPRDDVKPGYVCEVLQKGYRMGNRVLRYAMVKVASE